MIDPTFVVIVFLLGPILVIAQKDPNCSKLPDRNGLRGTASCCRFPAILDQQTMSQCWSELSSSSYSGQLKHCKSMECFFTKKNILQSDGSLDRTAIGAYLDTLFAGNDVWLNTIKQAALNHCLVGIEKNYDRILDFFRTNGMEFQEESKCSMKPMLLSICVGARGFAKCPANDWNESSTCDEWRKYLDSCTESVENTLEFYKQLDRAS
ncbi:general odorant-binding protein 66-like [Toxorhynchites rutilus septentrionalis]|uniref:general odorant-binding protein 66-like n=1 Tax=Toxorhynchites rutilus septentrionalis TaxID=329112 RepID=UPI00247958E9|nr:general odorant-binding protein 66-like [Toxorhynchites rutilus septentrionalis]